MYNTLGVKFSPNPSPNSKANPNPNPNREGNFLWGDCPDTGKNKRNEKPKRNKKQQKKEKINKTKKLSFAKLKQTFPKTRTLISSS